MPCPKCDNSTDKLLEWDSDKEGGGPKILKFSKCVMGTAPNNITKINIGSIAAASSRRIFPTYSIRGRRPLSRPTGFSGFPPPFVRISRNLSLSSFPPRCGPKLGRVSATNLPVLAERYEGFRRRPFGISSDCHRQDSAAECDCRSKEHKKCVPIEG